MKETGSRKPAKSQRVKASEWCRTRLRPGILRRPSGESLCSDACIVYTCFLIAKIMSWGGVRIDGIWWYLKSIPFSCSRHYFSRTAMGNNKKLLSSITKHIRPPNIQQERHARTVGFLIILSSMHPCMDVAAAAVRRPHFRCQYCHEWTDEFLIQRDCLLKGC